MDEARHSFALRLPEHLCVMDYNNILLSGWSFCYLTTFVQPVEQCARDAVQWLIAQEERQIMLRPRAEQQHSRLRYEASVVWRGSVRRG